MVLDVFHPWPRDALIGVAERFMVVLEKNIPNEVGTKVFSNKILNFHQNSQETLLDLLNPLQAHLASEFTLTKRSAILVIWPLAGLSTALIAQEVLASVAQHAAEVHVSVYQEGWATICSNALQKQLIFEHQPKTIQNQWGGKLKTQDQFARNFDVGCSQANRRYLEEERRYNSTTPKSFLELISFYAPLQQRQTLTCLTCVVCVVCVVTCGFKNHWLSSSLELISALWSTWTLNLAPSFSKVMVHGFSNLRFGWNVTEFTKHIEVFIQNSHTDIHNYSTITKHEICELIWANTVVYISLYL